MWLAIAAEVFSDYLLFWIPFYYILKLAILTYCLKFDGAQKAYAMCFGPLLKQYEPHIDRVITYRCGDMLHAGAADWLLHTRGLRRCRRWERTPSSSLMMCVAVSCAIALVQIAGVR